MRMRGIYEWIRSMACYLILMTMILNLLPDKKYEKYLRLFTGMVFLMLVFSPFADMTGVEAQMAGAFERMTFANDAKLLRREIEDADGKRMERLVGAYEDAVKTDLQTMAEGGVLTCLEVHVQLDGELDGGNFGKIEQVEMVVGVHRAVGSAGEDMADVPVLAGGELRQKANREISDLRKRIGEYYGVEEGNIRITLENE